MINDNEVELVIHTMDNGDDEQEISEVYASVNGMEIEFDYSLMGMMSKLNANALLK